MADLAEKKHRPQTHLDTLPSITVLNTDTHSPSSLLQRVQLRVHKLTGYGEHHAINRFSRKISVDKRRECRKSVISSVDSKLALGEELG